MARLSIATCSRRRTRRSNNPLTEKMKLNSFLLAASLRSTANALSQATKFWVFLCFGQSNMESGGRMEEIDRSVDNRFRVLADFDAPNRGWQKGKHEDGSGDLGSHVHLLGQLRQARRSQ